MIILGALQRGLGQVNNIQAIIRTTNRLVVRGQHIAITNYNQSARPAQLRTTNQNQIRRVFTDENKATSIVDILDREIKDEQVELGQQAPANQFPGFTVETDGADVKLTKKAGASSVTVRFTVSSSLSEWPLEGQAGEEGPNSQLVCMPDFQVQVAKGNTTLEMSCYFEELDPEEPDSEQPSAPMFCIDEMVLYQGEPKETEFAVSAEYLPEDLQDALMQYLEDIHINEDFARNLVEFATAYERNQYIKFMERLKSFCM